jgi:hypothetical protein
MIPIHRQECQLLAISMVSPRHRITFWICGSAIAFATVRSARSTREQHATTTGSTTCKDTKRALYTVKSGITPSSCRQITALARC